MNQWQEAQLVAVQEPHPDELAPENFPPLLKPKREKSFSTFGLLHAEHRMLWVLLNTSFSNFEPQAVHLYS
jgi:hypothetical protein